LTKNEQLIALVQKMLDDASNLHITDYEFTCWLGVFESSLKRKKSFLSPKKRRKTSKQNARLVIDLNIVANEDEPFEFEQLIKRGHPRSNNAWLSKFVVMHLFSI